MRHYVILHLGAGTQSGCIYQLMADGEYPMADYAIFADTQQEPDWVYRQLEYLKSQPGPPIIEVTAGNLGEDLIHGRNTTNQRFAAIPAHTTYQEGVKGGKTKRQCTKEYKIEPINRWIRRDLLQLQPNAHMPADVQIVHLFGFSTDESDRAVRMQQRMPKTRPAPNLDVQQPLFGERIEPRVRRVWQTEPKETCDFPLFREDLLMSRRDAQQYIEKASGFEWRGSRCKICPLQGNTHWQEIKTHEPHTFDDACGIDVALRTTGAVANRDINEIMFLHRSCVPLSEATLDVAQTRLGGCDDGHCFM